MTSWKMLGKFRVKVYLNLKFYFSFKLKNGSATYEACKWLPLQRWRRFTGRGLFATEESHCEQLAPSVGKRSDWLRVIVTFLQPPSRCRCGISGMVDDAKCSFPIVIEIDSPERATILRLDAFVR